MKITASTSLSVARVLPFSRSLLLPGFSAVLPRIMSNFNYPNAWRDENISDDYHGRKIFDNFRWLEDPDSDDCRRFVDAQNAVSTPFIEKCQYRQDLFDWVKEKWNYPRYGCPSKHGDHYYYSYNSGLQNQSVLYVQDSLDGEPRVFMDPNKLSEDGTVALDGRAYSENGAYLAYALSESGSDWVTIKFKKAPSGEDLLDTLKNVKFSSMAWTHDHKGLFYNSYPKHEGKSDGTETTANLYQKLFFHKLETDQSKDVLVVEFADKPEWRIGAEVSDCGKYLIISPNESCDPVNRLYYVNLEQLSPNGIEGKLTYTKVVDNFEAKYEYITNEGSVFTFMTNLNAPNYKLMNIDFTKPEMEHWTTLVEEDKNSVLKWAACVNKNKLILCYLEDVKNKIYVHDLATGRLIKNLPLDVGTIVDYSGTTKDKEIFYYFMSFLTPGIIYRCDMVDDYAEPKVFRQVEVKNFDFNQYETKQMFYTSKDGMRVPMFIVHRKGLQQDGTNPTLLYGYGGFNISITPTFSAARLVFLQHMKGVYAMPNIRGGGEYGETWHKGGSLQNKQNSFDDFQCAAEYLINNNYTCRDRLIINGASNGGLLVGACVNQRPDLFGCAIAEVGVMDMLRFHKFTIGHAWTSDFGCADKPEDFEWLIKYSPLHNIKEPTDVQYPAVLLMTADHDDRVVPLHSLKYIAELQRVVGKSSKQTNPLMIKVDTKAGHGFGKPTAKKIQEFTDKYCFIIEALGLTCLE